MPTAGQLLTMETFVSTKSIHLTLVNTTVNVMAAEHPKCDITATKVTTPRKSRKVNEIFLIIVLKLNKLKFYA